jgi:hypothetical protein
MDHKIFKNIFLNLIMKNPINSYYFTESYK